MRLVFHESQAARKTLLANKLRAAVKVLPRVARLFKQLNKAWDVRRTKTPPKLYQF